jgi:DTW domain-containing protein YfiP
MATLMHFPDQKRAHCAECGYPQPTCVCAAVQPVFSRLQVDILQHPSETKAAKNTARLVQLCHSNTHIWVGEQPDDFAPLQQSLAQRHEKVAVLYPAEDAISLESYRIHAESAANRLLLIDGTWKKAYKIWQCNAWLRQFPAVVLNGYESRYDIRKAPRDGCLSTLEAVALSLQQLEPNVDTKPLFDVFDAMQSHFQRFRKAKE